MVLILVLFLIGCASDPPPVPVVVIQQAVPSAHVRRKRPDLTSVTLSIDLTKLSCEEACNACRRTPLGGGDQTAVCWAGISQRCSCDESQ